MDRLYSLSAARKPSSTEHAYLLEEDFTELARTSSLKDALETLERHAQLFVAEMAKSRIFVHAGVVCWRDRAVIIPGRSFSGKSTLVEALVRKGAVYYSDEYAVLDDRGQVYPFPRPLSVRDEKSRATPRLIEELGGRIGRSPAPVGLVVVTSYRPGARWRPRRLTPGRGALELLDNTVPARRQPEAALTAVQAVACRAPVLKGRRGEAADTALRILSKLDDRL